MATARSAAIEHRRFLFAVIGTLLFVLAFHPSDAGSTFPGVLPGTDIGGNLSPSYEPSGAAWHPRLAKLFVVSDTGIVSLMGADGSALTEWTVPGDLEAIAIADPAGTLIYLGIEDPDSIVEFDFANGTVLRTFDLTGTLQGPASSGLEALTFVPMECHPEGGQFYAGLQADGKIYVFDLPIVTSSTSTLAQHIQTIEPVVGRDDLSALDWDREHELLYAAYDSHDLLRTMLKTGAFVDEWNLPGGAQEGLALAACAMFVAQDGSQEILSYRFPTDSSDSDLDGFGYCFDNCPEVINVSQSDADLDGTGDSCDCAPLDDSLATPPTGVAEVSIDRSLATPTLTWAASEVAYDLGWGSISSLRLDGGTNSSLCLENDITGESVADGSPTPGAGTGYYFMLRGQNGCGAGSYGASTIGQERESPLGCLD